MPHADEGQIHAYLDRQGEFADPVKRRELGKHIADCSSCTRALKDARRVRAEAEELLRTSRVREVHAPPFAEIAARAQSRKQPAAVGVLAGKVAQHAEDEHDGGTPSTRRKFRVWRSLAWAATIVLAIGVGWSIRPLLIESSTSPQAMMGFDDAAAPQGASPSEPEPQSVEMAESRVQRREADTPAAPASAPTAALADEDAAKVLAGREAGEQRADSEQVTLATVDPQAAQEERFAALDSTARLHTAPSLRQVAAQRVRTGPTRIDSGIVATFAADSTLAESLAERELSRARDSSASADIAGVASRNEAVSIPLSFESDRSRLPGDWNVISREEAERILGGPLVWVPELEIVGLGRTETGNGVRLLQSTGSGALLELEIRAIVPPTAGDSRSGRPIRIRAMQSAQTNASNGTATIGRYLITAKAGFPEASLRGLLQQLTYAPTADQLRDH